jgi:protein-S-isoprenylcysteine O-methyltransferase Ste14
VRPLWGKSLAAFFTSRIEAIRRTKLYDLFAAMPFIAWLLFSAAQMLPPLAEQIALAKFFFFRISPSALPLSLVLNILSKACTLFFLSALVVMFAVRHHPVGRAQGLYGRFAALAGTFSAVGLVWLPPRELSSTLQVISLLLIIGGTAFALSAVLVLGRSISLMPEARRLITWGPYAVVRHPLYVGEMIATTGLAMQFLMPWALVLLGLNCILQFERARNEERLLVQAFPRYRDYMTTTARFLPSVWGKRPASAQPGDLAGEARRRPPEAAGGILTTVPIHCDSAAMADGSRCFPVPWHVDKISDGYVVRDGNGQALAYIYSRDSEAEARQTKMLTKDEARRIAINVARLPELLEKAQRD